MTRFLARLVIFGMSLPVFWVCLVLMIQPFPLANAFFLAKSEDRASTRLRTQEWNQSDSLRAQVQVLFLGSSTCGAGIDPSAMLGHGVNGFSLCSSGQRVGNSLQILSAAIKESSPSVVVLDVFPLLWDDQVTGVESSRDWSRNGIQSNHNWTRSIFINALESKNIYNVMLAAAEWCIQFSGLSTARSNTPDKGLYRGRGYQSRVRSSLSNMPECLSRRSGEVSANQSWCDVFNQVRTICVQEGAELIILIPPELCPTPMIVPACWHEIHVIRGQEWPGSQSPDFFFDNHHLVEAGAQSYSAWLAQILKQSIKLQNHGRSQPRNPQVHPRAHS